MKKFAQLFAVCAFVFALSMGTSYAQSASTESAVKVEKVSAKAVATPTTATVQKASCCKKEAVKPSCCSEMKQSSAAACHGSKASAKATSAATETKTAVAVSEKQEQ